MKQCAEAAGSRQTTSYKVTAVPERPGKTGNRGFCGDLSGAIAADPAGGTNCTETVE